MENLILKRIGGLIAAHSGIQIREQDYQTLSEKLWKRAKSLGLTSLEQYYNFLLQELESGIGANLQLGAGRSQITQSSEWQELYSILTINESYFFRDKNQFKLLENKLLPELIERKLGTAQAAHKYDSGSISGRPKLRIWSAGCSTGEELYSMAILLEEMHFPWHQWDALLIGTDISKTALSTAQKGLYGGWSFRQVPATIQQKYFCNHHHLFKINDNIRRRVKFAYGNLLKDIFPNRQGDLYDMDLILCRNVFIYLESSAIGQIIHKFHSTLDPQGFLLTGHTELYGQDISQFHIMSFPESVVYKQRPQPVQASPSSLQLLEKPAHQTNRLLTATSKVNASLHQRPPMPRQSALKVQPSSSIPASESWQGALKEAERLLKQEAYTNAILSAEKIFSAYPQCDAAVKIAAHAYANIGSYDRAKSLCQRVLKSHPLCVDMYYLLAQIAEEQNELDITKEYLRKIIYLDSSFVKAYLDLASIYEREKQPEKTKKMQTYALSLLDKLPASAVLDTHTGTTVSEWRQHLAAKILTTEN